MRVVGVIGNLKDCWENLEQGESKAAVEMRSEIVSVSFHLDTIVTYKSNKWAL